MLLQEYIPDQAKLQSYIEDGIVTRRPHTFLPLDIYCYGKRATYEQLWDDVTCKTRGLIVERETGLIIARPFEKFFNINDERFPETMEESLRDLSTRAERVITEKLDGSLGILWKYDNYVGIATKGSFNSDHAAWATEKYVSSERFPSLYVWPEGYTPVFEMVCESVQHHVVYYGEDKLSLLALINIETGVEMHYSNVRQWARCNGMEVVERYNITLSETIKDRPNAEGYIATWYNTDRPPLRVKIKHEEFLRLQRIHHHTTPKTIFKALQEADAKHIADALRADAHLARQVDAWVFAFNRAYGDAFVGASAIVARALTVCTTRKEFALFFLQPECKKYSGICFKMMDQLDHSKAIWKFVEDSDIIQEQKYDEIEEE